MGSEWKQVRLVDVVSHLGDGLHGTPQYTDNGEYYFINGNNLDKGRIVPNSKTRRVGHADYIKHRKNLNDRTLLVSINGTIGNVAAYNDEKIILGKSACYFNIVDHVSKEYIYYVVSSPKFRLYIEQQATGTTIKNVSLRTMRDFQFQLPPLGVQKMVAGILRSLDDKIELNRKTNQTLESMAQALFKSWFVDFDPAIDNTLAEGNEIPELLTAKAHARRALRENGSDKTNQPHTLPEHIRQLFPSRLQFTEEQGWIPEGWSVKPFLAVAQHIRESASAQNINPSEVYVGLEHIGRKKLFLENSGVGSDVESNKSRFKTGDVLFGKLRPYFHKVALTDTDGICSTDILVFRAEDAAYQAFMALTAYRKDFVAHANACSSGTRMPRANAKDLLAYQVVMPTRDVVQQFEAVVAPMWERAHRNVLENARLADIRDTLLPKLLSGELRIPVAARKMDAALA